MEQVFLAIGTNIGDRKANLLEAINFINQEIGSVQMASSIYETAAWGLENQASFLNQVLLIKPQNKDWNPLILLAKCQQIEIKMGRVKFEEWGPRLIDIDILFCDNLVLNEAVLSIPHQLLQERKFVLIPMAEIAPDLVHPVFQKTIQKLLEECADKLLVSCIK